MKKAKVLFLLCSVLFLGASCSDEESVQGVYGFDIYEFNSSNWNNLQVVRNYFTAKGCIINNQVFKADSEAELDKQAITLFNENVKKIDSDELMSLLTDGTTSFTYGLGKATTEEASNTGYLKKKEYEFLKLIVHP
jgi:hypothetical protein